MCVYVCVFVCVCTCVCVCMCVCILSLQPSSSTCPTPFTSLSYISLPMSTVEGSSEKRVLTLPPYSPTVGVHSVRQLHVGASRLSRVLCRMPAARASRAPVSLLALFAHPAHSAMGARAFAPAIPAVVPDAFMRADTRAPAVLAGAPAAVMLKDACPPGASLVRG